MSAPTSGHVFVVHGSVTQLACDAWLVPGDRFGPGPIWRERVGEGPYLYPDEAPGVAPFPDQRVWRWNVRVEGDPVPYHGRLGARGKDVEWYVETARQFLRVAAPEVKTPKNKRALPLLAMPLLGTGHGGAASRAGLVAAALLRELYAFTANHAVDVALVLIDHVHYAAAQAVRRREFGPAGWDLPEPLRARAAELAQLALSNRLVLFLGAGVSKAAGLPLWTELLRDLAAATIPDPAHRAALDRLDHLDQAAILDQRLRDDGSAMRARIIERLTAPRYALPHGLLASLPCREVVTTNYDTLFERASRAAGRPAAVLPYQPVDTPGRWLLKLHGCIEQDDDDIVISRADYHRYRERRQALAGIVQTLLITRHMLFVGFSLNDPNFLAIVDAVRVAVGGDRLLGSALWLEQNPLLGELWPDLEHLDLSVVGEPVEVTARRLEIFLDAVGAAAVDTPAHLFDRRYGPVLDDDERALRDRLRSFVASTPTAERQGPAWREVQRMLERMGWRADQGRRPPN